MAEHQSRFTFDARKPAFTKDARVFFTELIGRGAESEAFQVERHFHDGRILPSVALIALNGKPKLDDYRLDLVKDISPDLVSGNTPSEAITLPNGTQTFATFVECKGRSLADVLKDQHDTPAKVPTETMAAIMARTLLAIHDRGIIHGDIKPGNLLIDEQGKSYLCDWGIVTKEGDERQPNDHLGTAHYMAPETIVGQPTQKSDVFALCYTAYEAVTARPARIFYDGTDRGEFDWMNTVVNQQRILKTPDPVFNEILSGGTWNDPGKRSSPFDMLADLAAYPQAWKEYPPELQQRILAHVEARALAEPKRSPLIDAAVLAHRQDRGTAAPEQPHQDAHQGYGQGSASAPLRFTDNEVFRPGVLRGEAIGISQEAYQSMSQEDIRKVCQTWQKSLDSGQFSHEQREAILAIRANHRHLNGSSTDSLTQTVVTDWQRFERSLDADAVYVAHQQGDHVVEGVALRRGSHMVPDGLWVETSASGHLASCTTYRQGIKEGEERTFHDNGMIKKITHYLHNMPHGAESEFDHNGTQTIKRTHEHGHLVKEVRPGTTLAHRAKRLFHRR